MAALDVQELTPLVDNADDTSMESEEGADTDKQPLKSADQLDGKEYGSSDNEPSEWRKRERGWDSLVTGAKETLGHLMFWRKKGPSPPREIAINNPEENRGFSSNRISTTKYNVLTFFPLFLVDQFRRLANFFFLCIALLQQIPNVSPTGRYTTAVPLFLVLLATAIKEIIEDIRRFKADNEVNRRKVNVLRNGSWQTVHWTKVVVGDIVLVQNKQFFPADLLLLSSSEPQGICYIQTSNLDGETSLKIRQAHPLTAELTSEEELASLEGYVECEGPNNRLYEFTGNLKLEGREKQPIIADQILLRGAQLRNTRLVYGLVLYTGHNSKLLQNATRAPLKRSNMDLMINRQVIYLIFVLLGLSFFSAIGTTVWNKLHVDKEDHWYLMIDSDQGSKFLNFIFSMLTFIILYNNLIPISLLVTLEVVKFLQAFFINYDVEMYDEASDTPALSRNSNLNEELGQVRYIFADKTGTLTENIMEFKKCTVAGQVYGMEPTSSSEEPYPVIGLREALQGLHDHAQFTLLEFLKVLSLCHTVVPEREKGEIVYRASSPDEEALVKAAKSLGVIFEVRTPNSVIIDVCGKKEEYQVLNLLEFNSTRKRMSVIVRTPQGEIKLFCKGADTVIYERLQDNESFATVTEKHLEYFAVDGLRTLCVAEATIDEESYERWSQHYYAASIATEDRENKLDEAAELIEKDLQLLGATAIEDWLQEGVPESIAAFRKANIKVWVLTGDKRETAVNIGFASRQLTANMKLMTVVETSLEAVDAKISDFISQIGKKNLKKEQNVALIITGKALSHALNERVSNNFLELALACKSVICCRVSPLQKANIVKLVKTKVKDSITLAIGDGANDVGMIQAAHVGVGISGREGLQATLASDYSIAQFRFLVRLLFVHGAWNYNRLAKVILYSFYKNICLYSMEFWFAFINGFSGQPLFDEWIIGVYNVIFTSMPPFVLGLMDQDVSATGRMKRPSLYKPSQEKKGFNGRVFWKWIVLSLVHSFVLFTALYFLLFNETPYENGKVFGLWFVGNTIYTAVVITVCLKAGLEIEYWTPAVHVAIWGSIFLWFVFIVVYSHLWPALPFGEFFIGQDVNLFKTPTFYALFLWGPLVALYPDFIMKVMQKTFFPTEVDRVRQQEILSKKKGRELDYESLDGISVSYSARSAGAAGYGDGLDETLDTALSYPPHGYAFSQEDHGILRKGSSKVQRREVIRMYDTTQQKQE